MVGMENNMHRSKTCMWTYSRALIQTTLTHTHTQIVWIKKNERKILSCSRSFISSQNKMKTTSTAVLSMCGTMKTKYRVISFCEIHFCWLNLNFFKFSSDGVKIRFMKIGFNDWNCTFLKRFEFHYKWIELDMCKNNNNNNNISNANANEKWWTTNVIQWSEKRKQICRTLSQ